jgi:hypothetical protein
VHNHEIWPTGWDMLVLIPLSRLTAVSPRCAQESNWQLLLAVLPHVPQHASDGGCRPKAAPKLAIGALLLPDYCRRVGHRKRSGYRGGVEDENGGPK